MVRAGIAHLKQQKCYDVYSEFLGNPVRMVFKPKKTKNLDARSA